MPQLEHIEAIEKRLWSAADNLRANSNYASNEYFLPVMGLIFLRHAYSRYLMVKEDVEANLPKRGGKTRPLTKEDFSQKGAIFLRPEAQFDHLVSLKDKDDRAEALSKAMESIEEDYASLRGVLPKEEYRELENSILGQLLRTLNPEDLKHVSGDVFGRIYEYFLTQFANQDAHDGGEFFTPISLVSLIAHIIEPAKGVVLDPACGSGGMFVQSARVVESHLENPAERLTFYGMEKNQTTIRLAKMNLAVHGLEGNIQRAITYYEDPHELLAKADYVMANPPFNVDEIDADKVKTDPRLPFGLPGVNKEKKVSNGNYIWISYFYSYLNERGRAGFVMSSQASSAGRDEAKVRQFLVETGDVEAMVAIRSNFFYTRSVPCELWFFNRKKPESRKDKILMIDARNVYRKVTRKIYDFSPEQEKNLLSIVWLYRGETQRYLELVSDYCQTAIRKAEECFDAKDDVGQNFQALPDLLESFDRFGKDTETFIKSNGAGHETEDIQKEFRETFQSLKKSIESFRSEATSHSKEWQKGKKTNGALKKGVDTLSNLAESSRDLIKEADLLYKLAGRLIESVPVNARKEKDSKKKEIITRSQINKSLKNLDQARQIAVEMLGPVRYFWKQAHWLTERFPDAKLRDVEGLVKVVSRKEVESNDWSLTPGRYVGVAPEETDEDFDFEEVMREIHVELEDLNAESVRLAGVIKKNFEELGI